MSSKTQWRIRFVRNGVAERVFKVENKSLVLWVVFDNQDVHRIRYVSPKATQYARTRSGLVPFQMQQPQSVSNRPRNQIRIRLDRPHATSKRE